MPDSPKCLDCLDSGRTGQTYKIAGKASFQCHDCKVIYTAISFEPEAFEWKENPEKWRAWLKQKSSPKQKETKSSEAIGTLK